MKKLLVVIYGALAMTAFYPVYESSILWRRIGISISVPWRDASGLYSIHMIPAEEALRAFHGNSWLRSVVVAGLPALLSLLNLPVIVILKGETGDRWRAFSSLILGFLSTAMMFQLNLRYGYGREWGAAVIFFDSLLLLIAGTAAAARLRSAVDAPLDTRNPVTPSA